MCTSSGMFIWCIHSLSMIWPVRILGRGEKSVKYFGGEFQARPRSKLHEQMKRPKCTHSGRVTREPATTMTLAVVNYEVISRHDRKKNDNRRTA